MTSNLAIPRVTERCQAISIKSGVRCHCNAGMIVTVRRRRPDSTLCGVHYRIYQRYGYELGPHSLRLAL